MNCTDRKCGALDCTNCHPERVPCACVHPRADECARIRDGGHAKDDPDYHRRACECACHKEEYEDDDD